jgi:hypothetical protein
MSRSQLKLLAEFSVPAMAMGAVAALGAGVLAAVAGQPAGWAVIGGLALGLPISLFGAGYSSLVALRKVPIGVFTPAGVYWLVGFPLAMLVHSSVTEWLVTGAPGLPEGPLWGFLAYNALISMGFAIGFLWSHEYLGRHWWPRIRDHNPYAARCVEEYVDLATVIHDRTEERARIRREKKMRKASQAAPIAKGS